MHEAYLSIILVKDMIENIQIEAISKNIRDALAYVRRVITKKICVYQKEYVLIDPRQRACFGGFICKGVRDHFVDTCRNIAQHGSVWGHRIF